MGRSLTINPESLARARKTLTDLDLMQILTEDQRRQIVDSARAILHTERIHRDGVETQAPARPGAVVNVPLALFQAGLRARRLPSTARPALPTTPTPGDAA